MLLKFFPPTEEIHYLVHTGEIAISVKVH